MKFIVFTYRFTIYCGGFTVLYNLAKDLNEIGHDVFVYTDSASHKKNPIYSRYATKKDVDEETIVIYPEIVKGNPLGAKRVIRWILCELGKHCPGDVWKTWNPSDMVYFYSTYTTTIKSSAVNILFSLFKNPVIHNKNDKGERDKIYYILRKAKKYHATIPHYFPNEEKINDNMNHEQLTDTFNQAKILVSYDPYSWIAFIAALCGCPAIVHPLLGITKKEWLDTLYIAPYLQHTGKQDVAGIAYGVDDLQHAIDTLDKVNEEQEDCVLFGKGTVAKMCEQVTSQSGLKFVKDYWYS